MNKETAIKIFEQKKIRSHWDDEQEKWIEIDKKPRSGKHILLTL